MPSSPPVRDAEAPLRAALAEVDRGARLQVLDVSFSSAVLRFGSTVARVARNGDAQRGHQREAMLLPLLTGRLPVVIPAPIRLVPSKPGLPFGAALQPWIDGRTMSTRDPRRRPELVDEIVRALAALHAVSVDLAPSGVLPTLDPLEELERLEREALPTLGATLAPRTFDRFRRRIASLRESTVGGARVLCHGDAWHGNLLVDDRRRLIAMLDFEDACVADPALDLAALFHLDPPLARRGVDAYVAARGDEGGLPGRIQAYRMIREVAGFAYLVRNDITEEIDDAVRKIEALIP
jgi:aminoglycoside phosphotransferase (APT) family kinase protein